MSDCYQSKLNAGVFRLINIKPITVILYFSLCHCYMGGCMVTLPSRQNVEKVNLTTSRYGK